MMLQMLQGFVVGLAVQHDYYSRVSKLNHRLYIKDGYHQFDSVFETSD